MLPETGHRKKGRRLRVFLVGVAILAAVYGSYRVVLARWARIPDDGTLWTLEEINAWHSEVTPEENAAQLYLQAFDAFQDPEDLFDLTPVVGMADLPDRSEAFPEEMKKAAEAYLDANARALVLLHEAAARTKCRYPIDITDIYGTADDHLTRMRQAARLLSLEAIIHAENQRPEMASEALVAGLAVGWSLHDEPLHISQVVWIACMGITYRSLERVLNRTAMSDVALASLADTLARGESTPETRRRVIELELRIDLAALDDGVPFWPLVHRNVTYLGPTLNAALRGLKIVTYKWFGRHLERAAYTQLMLRLMEVNEQEFPGRLDTYDSLVDELPALPEWCAPGSNPVFRTLKRTATSEAGCIASIRVARAAVAVEQYRLAKGGLPNNLSELVPEYLTEIPEDPFDGEPLRYRQTPGGYTVYSIGQDRQDDDGKEGWRDGDITLTVERPAAGVVPVAQNSG